MFGLLVVDRTLFTLGASSLIRFWHSMYGNLTLVLVSHHGKIFNSSGTMNGMIVQIGMRHGAIGWTPFKALRVDTGIIRFRLNAWRIETKRLPLHTRERYLSV